MARGHGVLRFNSQHPDPAAPGTPALVLGNGESRISFKSKQQAADAVGLKLEDLEPHDWNTIIKSHPKVLSWLMQEYTHISNMGVTVVGCNALYRQWWPDFLVSVDPKMNNEIKRTPFPKDRFIYRNAAGLASGPCALVFAAHRLHNPIYIAGFDMAYADRKDENGKPLTNNVFRDSVNYHKSTTAQVAPVSWLQHTSMILSHYPDLRYVQVGPPFSMKPPLPKWHTRAQVDGKTEQWLKDKMEFCTWDEMVKELTNGCK